MNRRRFTLGLATGVGLITARASAQPIELETVRMQAPSGTPEPDLPLYDGEIEVVRDEASLLEGKVIEFRGTILQRFVAPEGRGYRAGNDGLVYRSMLHMEPDGESWDLFVATNDDLEDLEDLVTARVVGSYGGKFEYEKGGRWTVPLIIAQEISPASEGRS